MRKPILAILTILLLAPGAQAEPPHIFHTEKVQDPPRRLVAQELWRRGGEDDELFFGAIRNVSLGPDGNIYVLDQQRSQVTVLDAEGNFLRNLSREGEGPGECRLPEDQVFLPDGTLGIAQYINGRIIKIDLDGTPRETLMPPGFDPLEGGAMSHIRRVRWRAGTFVVNGVSARPEGDGMVRTQYLVRCDDQARPLVEYLSRTVPANIGQDGWVEKVHYFPSHERWDIDEQGRLLAATERNDYRISVFEPDGSTAFTFGRKEKPRKRTQAEKDRIADSVTVLRDGQRMQIDVQVEETDPAIQALYCRPGGETWVLSGRGSRGQPEGVMATLDAFAADGKFLRQVALVLPGDPTEDALFFLDDDRVALVRGAVQARRNTFGGGNADGKEVPVHDLIVYRLP